MYNVQQGTIQGKDTILLLQKNGVFIPFVCSKQITVDIGADKIETKTVGDGVWKKYAYQSLSYSIALSNVTKFDDANFTDWDFIDNMLQFLPVNFKLLFVDTKTGTTKRLVGQVLIEKSTLTASAIDLVTNELSLPGTGPLLIQNPADDCFVAITSGALIQTGPDAVYRITGHTDVISRADYRVDGGGYLSAFPTTFVFDLTLPSGLSVGVHTLDIIPFCANGFPGTMFSTTFTIAAVFSASFKLDTVAANICDNSLVTLFYSGVFGPGTALFTDAGLTTPITGSTFVIISGNNKIYNLDTSTGIVGADSGNICTIGNPVNVIFGNSVSTICANSAVVRYVSAGFSIGATIYDDVYLTTPHTGNTFVVNADNPAASIYNLNSSTGVITSITLFDCSGPTFYDLVAHKEVQQDHLSIKVTNQTSLVQTTYTFNELSNDKTFANVLVGGVLYTIEVTLLPFGRASAPITITGGDGDVTNVNPGTTLTAIGQRSETAGISVDIEI